MFAGLTNQRNRQQQRRAQHRKADDVLPFVYDRPLRQNFLQFSGGDHAPGERQRADDHFEPDFAHAESREVGHAHVVFGDADHRGGKRAEGMAQRGPLRHGRHLDHAERDADGRADDQRDDDPLVLDQFGIESVAPTASAAAISPASTPRRAEAGELSHLIDRMKRTVATM